MAFGHSVLGCVPFLQQLHFFAVEGYVQSVYPGSVMRRGRGSYRQSDVPHWRGMLPKRASDIQRVIRVSESFFAMLSALGSDAARR